jgi:hypothetical protein
MTLNENGRRSLKQDCSCLCGATRFGVKGAPIGRFFCHCTICRKVYRKPFADVTYFRAAAVNLPADQPVEFRRYRPPRGVRRAICARCDNPVAAFLTMVPGVSVAFVSSQNFPPSAELPTPDSHIFYRWRVAEIADAVPKLSGSWSSQSYVARKVFADLFRPGRAA